MTLGIVAAVLFGVAALGGLVLAVMRLRGRELPPLGLALVHGVVAAAGLVLLIVALAGGPAAKLAVIALVGFVIAALGGFVIFSFHLRKKALPIPVIVVHALVAVASFVILLVGLGAHG